MLDMAEGRDLSTEDNEERKKLRLELQSLITQEEIYWKQRSRKQWIKEGGKNTKSFHICASNRRRRNEVLEIHDNGRLLKKEEDIQEAFLKYFSSLLGTNVNGKVKALWNLLYPEDPPNLSHLDTVITEDEVKNAVFNLAKDKVPVLERFSYFVLQKILGNH